MLGLVRMAQGLYLDAVKNFRTCLKIKPTMRKAHFKIAVSYLKLRKSGLARRHARKAKRLGWNPQEIDQLMNDINNESR